jgi:hypothetical protein
MSPISGLVGAENRGYTVAREGGLNDWGAGEESGGGDDRVSNSPLHIRPYR